jgi:steroid delta-isomerase-like uncharacterized protein
MEDQELSKIILAYNEAWNLRDLDAVLAYHTPDSVFENHTTGESAVGRGAIRLMIERYFRTFPDLAFSVRRMYARSGLLVQEWTAAAHHTRPIPTRVKVYQPTGHRLSWCGVDVMPMRDGLIVRKDTYSDSAALVRQLEAFLR